MRIYAACHKPLRFRVVCYIALIVAIADWHRNCNPERVHQSRVHCLTIQPVERHWEHPVYGKAGPPPTAMMKQQGLDLPSCFKWLKMRQNPLYKAMVFSHWKTSNIGYDWSPREGKQVRGALWLFQLTACSEFSGCSPGRGSQVEPSGLPELRKWNWESREDKVA